MGFSGVETKLSSLDILQIETLLKGADLEKIGSREGVRFNNSRYVAQTEEKTIDLGGGLKVALNSKALQAGNATFAAAMARHNEIPLIEVASNDLDTSPVRSSGDGSTLARRPSIYSVGQQIAGGIVSRFEGTRLFGEAVVTYFQVMAKAAFSALVDMNPFSLSADKKFAADLELFNEAKAKRELEAGISVVKAQVGLKASTRLMSLEKLFYTFAGAVNIADSPKAKVTIVPESNVYENILTKVRTLEKNEKPNLSAETCITELQRKVEAALATAEGREALKNSTFLGHLAAAN